MAEMIQYPEYHTYFHREDPKSRVTCKCPQCGKELTKYKNCVCPNCGAFIGEEMYHENEALVEQVICGYVESSYELEDGLISNEVFEERMKSLEQVSKKLKACSEELMKHFENEFNANDKIGKFQNSLLYRFTYGFYSLMGALVAHSETIEHPEIIAGGTGFQPVLLWSLGSVGVFFLFGSFFGEGFGVVILVLLGLLFLMPSIVAIVERILSRKPNETWFIHRWTYWKSTIHNRLLRYFSSKVYQEKSLDVFYVVELSKLVRLNKADQNNNPEDSQWMCDAYTMLASQIILIKHDYLRSKGNESPDSTSKEDESWRNRWRNIYEKYEV